MKKTTQTSITETTSCQLTDQQVNEMENDSLWDLVDKADSPIEASPLFSRNVMREIRLLDEHGTSTVDSTSLWQSIISPNFAKYGLGVAAAAVCAFLVTVMLPSTNIEDNLVNTNQSIDIEFIKDIPLESLSVYSENVEISATEDMFTAEILDLVDQDPLFMSEEDIDLAMNF